MAIIQSTHKIKVFQFALQTSLFTAVKYSKFLKKSKTNKRLKKTLVDEAILNVAQRQG